MANGDGYSGVPEPAESWVYRFIYVHWTGCFGGHTPPLGPAGYARAMYRKAHQ